MYIKSVATSTDNLLTQLSTAMTSNNWQLLVDRVQTTRELFFKNLSTNVIIGVKIVTDNITYKNLIFTSVLSFNSANNFYNQTGSVGTSITGDFAKCAAVVKDIDFNFHLFINNNRIILVNNISSFYSTVYAGNLNAVVNPGLYANPSYLCGSLDSYNTQDQTSNSYNNNFGIFNDESSLRTSDNSFVKVSNVIYDSAIYYPLFQNGSSTTTYNYTKDLYVDILIFDLNGPAGYIDGIVRYFGNNASALSEFMHDGFTYILFPNVYRSNQDQYFAVRKN